MFKRFSLPITSLLVLGLSGCTGVREKMGLDPNAPDEFTVYDRAPLSVPPKYALRPPLSGEQDSTAGVNASVAAEKIVVGGQSVPQRPTQASHIEQEVLQSVGAEKADADIRAQVDGDLSLEQQPTDKKLIDDLFSFKKSKNEGKALDPEMEKKRMNTKKTDTPSSSNQ
jgi:hypothetical protein